VHVSRALRARALKSRAWPWRAPQRAAELLRAVVREELHKGRLPTERAPLVGERRVHTRERLHEDVRHGEQVKLDGSAQGEPRERRAGGAGAAVARDAVVAL
jgi:hypothetical protein